jgi:hypothetical protein
MVNGHQQSDLNSLRVYIGPQSKCPHKLAHCLNQGGVGAGKAIQAEFLVTEVSFWGRVGR